MLNSHWYHYCGLVYCKFGGERKDKFGVFVHQLFEKKMNFIQK